MLIGEAKEDVQSVRQADRTASRVVAYFTARRAAGKLTIEDVVAWAKAVGREPLAVLAEGHRPIAVVYGLRTA